MKLNSISPANHFVSESKNTQIGKFPDNTVYAAVGWSKSDLTHKGQYQFCNILMTFSLNKPL